MKKIKLLFCSSLLALSSSLYSPLFGQSWVWGRQGSGAVKGNDFGASVATDKYGNAFIAKQFLSQISFGPDTLFGNAVDNMYFVKYNSSGQIKWAKKPYQTSDANSFANAIATDNWGNIYITGNFNDTVTFGSFTLSASSINSYLVKYDSSGNVVWAVQSANPGTAFASGVTVDPKGNPVITGYFYYSAYFGAYALTNSAFNSDQGEAYIVKYDSSGNVIWAKQSVTSGYISYSQSTSISSDEFGNSYVTGFFGGTAIFDSYILSSNSVSTYQDGDVFLVKYDSNGTVIWAEQAITPSITNYGIGYGVTTDREGNPYITGYFSGAITFGSTSLVSADSSIFLAKYDSAGNPLWAEQSAGGSWMGYSLASDLFDNIYITGIGNADTLQFGGATLNNQPGSQSSFIFKTNSSGLALCGSMLVNGGGTGRNYEGVASDSTGQYIYTVGTLSGDTVFCASDTLVATNGGAAPYLARWMKCSTETGTNLIVSPVSSVSVFPNPNSGIFTVALCHTELASPDESVGRVSASQSKIEVYNVEGQKILNATLKQAQGDNTINLNGQPSGIYLYRLVTENGNLIGEGKVIIEK